jgi:hypothetical protein
VLARGSLTTQWLLGREHHFVAVFRLRVRAIFDLEPAVRCAVIVKSELSLCHLCFAKIKSAFGMNNIQRGDVTCAWRNYNSPGTPARMFETPHYGVTRYQSSECFGFITTASLEADFKLVLLVD